MPSVTGASFLRNFSAGRTESRKSFTVPQLLRLKTRQKNFRSVTFAGSKSLKVDRTRWLCRCERELFQILLAAVSRFENPAAKRPDRAILQIFQRIDLRVGRHARNKKKSRTEHDASLPDRARTEFERIRTNLTTNTAERTGNLL